MPVGGRAARLGRARARLSLAPPGRPNRSRAGELALVEVPLLVVQGERDAFGRPPPAPGRTLVVLRGDHALKSDVPGLRAAVAAWLASVLPPPPG